MPSVVVSLPAAWCFVPLRETDLVGDPAADNPPRYPNDGGLDWLKIANTVTDAVQTAQSLITDSLLEAFTVEVEKLPARDLYVVQEWLSVRPPEFGPSISEVVDGRHRTWHSREAGAVEAPVINSPVGDAVRWWGDDEDQYFKPDEETLAWWREERDWWDSSAAEAWSSRNRTHLRLWDEGLRKWSQRLEFRTQN